MEFAYSSRWDPPAPGFEVEVGRSLEDQHVRILAFLDSGSDQNVAPAELVRKLRLVYVGDARVLVYQGAEKVEVDKPVYAGHLIIGENLAGGIVRWLEHDYEASQDYVLLGREVLNQFLLRMDGPNLRGEIGPSSANVPALL